MKFIPQFVLNIGEKLESAGFETFLVGGSVRNILLGRPVKDYDLTTNAKPEDIAKIFPKSVTTNAKFGTVLVFGTDEFDQTQTVEITTYRSEKEYVGGRWPSHVEFSSHIEDDLKRRDFTINAIALRISEEFRILEYVSPDSFADYLLKGDLIVDLFEGRKDLDAGLIRSVGDPVERFTEDGLRSIRACRLASVLGFTIEERTFKGIQETLDVSAMISSTRVRDELIKLLNDSHKPSVGLELMRNSGLLQLFIPELLEGYGMEQNKFHVHDVYQHALDTVDIAPKEIRLAALFHDIGKPRSKDGEHFYGHDKVGAEMTQVILQRLNFPVKQIEETVNLIRWHMFYLPSSPLHYVDEHAHDNDKNHRTGSFKNGWSDSAIRRMIRRVGGQENIDSLLKLRIADATSNPKSTFDPADIQELSKRIAEIREQDSLISLSDLKISGHDLKSLGVPEGPKMKEILNYLLERVMDNIELNSKAKLEDLVKDFMNLNS